MSTRITARMAQRIREARAVHTRAADEYIARAQRVPESAWHVPLREGGWTPAQVTQHVALAFRAAAQDAAGGTPMALRLNWLARQVARLTIMRRVLGGAPLPRGARAPRETRPTTPAPALREDGLREFRAAHDALDAALDTVIASGATRRFTHPYFGRVSLADGVLVSARHVEHHIRDMGNEDARDA